MLNLLLTKKTDNGIINVKYIADKRLEADWAEIKKPTNKVNVRRFGMTGSPGWIRTNDRSVNSRLLCH